MPLEILLSPLPQDLPPWSTLCHQLLIRHPSCPHYNSAHARSLIPHVGLAPHPEILMLMHCRIHNESPDGWTQSSPHACPPSSHACPPSSHACPPSSRHSSGWWLLQHLTPPLEQEQPVQAAEAQEGDQDRPQQLQLSCILGSIFCHSPSNSCEIRSLEQLSLWSSLLSWVGLDWLWQQPQTQEVWARRWDSAQWASFRP